jgi:hypothetical protein
MKGWVHLSTLALNNYTPLVEKAKTESGNRASHIWLLVNPKYPSIRPDIWIPILEVIQDRVYRKLHKIIDIENIFIKNTVSDLGIVSRNSVSWSKEISQDIMALRESILEYRPKMVITFGTMIYELLNRICEVRSEKDFMYWSTTNLRHEFDRSLENFDITRINRIPLPSRIMTRGKFIEDWISWEDCENYFREIGTKIADKVIENNELLNIWI